MKYIPPNKQFYRRRGETLSLKQAFSKVVESSSFGNHYNRMLVLTSWDKVMGETVAKRTTRIFLKKKELFVQISSAPLRQELKVIRSQIIQRINEEVGREAISEIKFL